MRSTDAGAAALKGGPGSFAAAEGALMPLDLRAEPCPYPVGTANAKSARLF